MFKFARLYQSIKDWIIFRRTKITAVFLVSIAFSALILQYSFAQGRLSACPKFDDVSYLLAGAAPFHEYLADGLFGVIKGWISNPPHSPYAEGVSLLGFFLFGIEDWAPYVLNTCFVFLFLWIVLSCFGRINLLVAIAICIAACAIPLAGGGINEIRPDFMCSLLVAGGALRTVTGNFLKRSHAFQCVTGVFFGLALLVKPTVFPSTVILQTFSLAVAVAAAMLCEKVALKKKLPGVLLRFFGTTLALASLYYITGFSHVIAYIKAVLFSPQQEIWKLGAEYSNLDHLLFYINGFGAQTMLGIFAPLSYLILAGGLAAVICLRKKEWWIRYFALVSLLVPMYLVITITKVKTQYFGLTYFTYLILVAFFILGKFLTWSTVSGATIRRVVPAVFVALCLSSVFSFTYPFTSNAPDSAVRARESAIVNQMTNAFEHATAMEPVVFFHTIGAISPEAIAYTMLKHGVRMYCNFDGFTTDISTLRKKGSRADYIVISQPGTPMVAEFFPSIRLREPLISALKLDKGYVEFADLSMPPGKYFVFEHLRPFCGFKPITGIIQSKMPQQSIESIDVFVTNAPTIKLAVYALKQGKWKINLDLKAMEHSQLIFNLDGKKIGDVLVQNDFSTHTMEFELTQGSHEIVISAGDSQKSAGSVTFRCLQVVPATPAAPTTSAMPLAPSVRNNH